MVWQPPTSKTSTAFWKSCGASPFPISAGGGRYCFKGVGSHADTGRRLFLSGHAPDLGHYPSCHKGSAQGRYGQCTGRLQCHETNQGRKEVTGRAGFLSGCVHCPYVYAASNPIREAVGAGAYGFEECYEENSGI